MFCPFNMILLIQPQDQGMILILLVHYLRKMFNGPIKETENNKMMVKHFQRSYTISDTKIADAYKKSVVDVLMECCIIYALSVGTNSADLTWMETLHRLVWSFWSSHDQQALKGLKRWCGESAWILLRGPIKWRSFQAWKVMWGGKRTWGSAFLEVQEF